MPRRNGTGIALLADPRRREILVMVSERPRRPSEVARILGINRSTAGRHLRALSDAGILRRRWSDLDGRSIVYSIDTRRVGQIMAWLAGTQVGFPEPDRDHGADAHFRAMMRGARRDAQRRWGD